MMHSIEHTILYNIQSSGVQSGSGLLLRPTTDLFELSLCPLQLAPPARLLLLHAVLEELQDALLWMQQERQLSLTPETPAY